jgi:uncharacterized membrane-anchored protein
MNKFIKPGVLVLSAVLVFVVINLMTYKKERTLQNGKVMLLELAPVDPRSLMQGDYMALRYSIARNLRADTLPKDGTFVVSLDDAGVATFKRVHDSGIALSAGEHLLRYRVRASGIRLGAESFFFQEGHAKVYSRAKYGELRVADSGDSVLVGLRGENQERLAPTEKATSN